jgi:hypothetical protein
MDLFLKNLAETECWVFICDIVYLDTAEKHAKRLTDVFERFRRATLQIQPENCVFAKDTVPYLGFELSYRGIEASPGKVKAVQNFPVPRSVKDVRSFLGLASFYWRHPILLTLPSLLQRRTKYGIGIKNVRSHSMS